MNRSIRRVAAGVAALFGLLVAQLTYLQVIAADRLAGDPRNARTFLRDFTTERGDIVSADGAVLARSVPSDDEYRWQREYPTGELFAQVVGYQSVVVGSTGVERAYNDVLLGRSVPGGRLRDLGALLLERRRAGTVVLSLRSDAQLVAKQALGDQRGSVVVVEPATGAVVAMYSNPSFDPAPLAAHDPEAVQAAFDALRTDPANPALPRAWRERYPPGSTFKIVTTAAALATGAATPDRTFPVVASIPLPQSRNRIQNFGGRACGGSLEQSFVRSCNTTFATLGLELGPGFPPVVDGFGITGSPPLDVDPGPVAGSGPRPDQWRLEQPAFALAAIGQGPVTATPLHMALVAAAVANRGVVMRPRVAAEIRDPDGRVLRRVPPQPWRRALSPEDAATIGRFMVATVDRGTGTAARIPGVAVAGKTGTAQCGPGCPPHAWFVAFAPAEAPRYAVAVIVENGGTLRDEATGGRVAAPVAAQVLRYLLGR